MIIDLKDENWYPIKGYEETHMISDKFRFKALSRSWYSGNGYKTYREKEEQLLEYSNAIGYSVVTLIKNGVVARKFVHRLIAIHFIPNPENKPFINHKNGIRNDNRIENLEWCTAQENSMHAIKTGLATIKRRGDHSQAKRVKCETYDMNFECAADAADVFGLGEYCVQRVSRGEQLHTQGLVFRYL